MGLTFRLLFIGDVVGEAGRAVVSTLVPVLRRELELDAVVANGENSAPTGRGITPESASELLSVVDFLTLATTPLTWKGVRSSWIGSRGWYVRQTWRRARQGMGGVRSRRGACGSGLPTYRAGCS